MPADPSVPTSRRPPSPRSPQSRPALTPISDEREISLGVAVFTWLCGWLAGNIAGTAVVAAAGYASTPSAERPVWVSAAAAAALWIPQLASLAVVSRSVGHGSFAKDYSLRFRPIDLAGIPIGLLSQLVLLRLVYWPLQSIWPDAFSSDELEQNARDLYDTANGGWLVLLVLMVVVVAPFVEELVYRGLLQNAARRRLKDVAAVVAVAAFFAVIHLRPVEYPGLFAFGLVLGACAVATDRLGMSIAAHVAFNATGLALVAG